MSTQTTIPPPLAHRHDFEEMFHVLEGEVDVTIRGETSNANIGEKVNVPAPAPHSFHNRTDRRSCCASSRPPVSRRTSPRSAIPCQTAPRPRRSHAGRRLDDRLSNARVRAAAADVAQRVDVSVRDLPALGLDLVHEGNRGHDLTRLAVAALRNVVLELRLLHRVQLLADGRR